MLIRLIDHFRDNPKRIDKLISIKGLPDDWFFRDSDIGRELKKPWEPDVDKNIPYDIQHLCDPMYVVIRYPAINANNKEFIEKRKIMGVRIDYNSEPGRQMWDDVERYIEETMPRNERVPVAVLCARDERSSFETYTPRRNSRGSLELVPGPVPSVDLTKYSVKTEVAQEIVPKEEEKPSVFNCEACDYTHKSKQGIRMHSTKKHSKKESVGV